MTFQETFGAQQHPVWSTVLLALGLAAAALSGGCLSRPNLATQAFLFAIPPGLGNATNGPVLSIDRVTVAAPFESQALIYRTGDFSFEQDSYASFLVPPADTLAAAIEAHLRATGLFGRVVERGSLERANTLLEVHASQLYGDFRKSVEPAAVLELRFAFFDASRGASSSILFAKSYRREIPLGKPTAAELVAGWNEGLKQIVAEAAADFRAHAPAMTNKMSRGWNHLTFR